MTAPNINLFQRPAMTSDTRFIDIFSAADYGPVAVQPNSDGVPRARLVPGAWYRVHETFVTPKLFMPPVVEIGNFENLVFQGMQNNTTMLIIVNNDLVGHIWGRETGAMNLEGRQFVDIGNAGAGKSAVCWDFVGGNSSFSVIAGTVFAHVNFKEIGRFVDLGIFQEGISQEFGNDSGYIMRMTPANAAAGNSGIVTARRFISPSFLPDARTPMFSFLGAWPELVMANCGINLGKAANSFAHIDSATAQGNYNFGGNAYQGPALSGNFFRPDFSDGIDAFAEAQITITGFSDSTADPGVDTTVEFGTIVDFTRGQTILISGATQGSLNTTHIITRVNADQTSFDVAIVFATNSAAVLEQTLAGIAAGFPFVRDETITITGLITNTNYNGTFQILKIISDTAFTIPVAFGTDEGGVGTITSTGRDQSSVGVLCTANGAQENSKTLGAAASNAQATTTTPADGTYGATNFGTLVLDSASERVTLTTPAQGIFTYMGESPATLKISGPLNAAKSGSTRSYRFAPSVDGAIPVFASSSFAPFSIQSVNGNTYFSFFVDVLPNETVQLMSAGDGTTDAFTITDTLIAIEEV